MTYDPERQFRSTIIRGKAKTDLDNLLPNYAQIISDICPIAYDEFVRQFDARLGQLLPESTEKTLANHRTEIAGKLFGMYYLDDAGIAYASERTNVLLENEDQPFFFKDICFKFQFPSGMDSEGTLHEKVVAEISIRQFPYILKLMLLAKDANIELAEDEIGYYVLNSLDVLKGEVSPEEVLKAIVADREKHDYKKVSYPGKASSYNTQHIREQIGLLELANLIRKDGETVLINPREMDTVQFFASFHNVKPEFDVYSYDLSNPTERKRLYFMWDVYYAKLSPEARNRFTTTVEAIEYLPGETEEGATRRPTTSVDTVALGDDGEIYVWGYEKKRVGAYNPALVSKVKLLSKTKGLGYDIQSVVAEAGENAEFAKYLEVKATKRVTAPSRTDNSWMDSVNITRNEYVAAQQHTSSYHICRVYFTSEGTVMFILTDVYEKIRSGLIKSTPLTYRLDFRADAIDKEAV